MAEPTFSLPQSSFGELFKMVHAYFLADVRSKGEAVSVPETAQLAGIDPTTLSRNNSFFAALGLIEGGRRKKLTDRGRELGLGISHNDPQLISAALARIVGESDFLTKILGAVRIRGGMDAASLQTHIAVSVGAPRGSRTSMGAASVMQLLVESGHLVDDEGTFRASDSPTLPASPEPLDHIEQSAAPAYESRVIRRPSATTRPGTGGVVININLNVTTESVDDVTELLRRLTGWPPLDSQDEGASGQ
jgi:hypothetical protein